MQIRNIDTGVTTKYTVTRKKKVTLTGALKSANVLHKIAKILQWDKFPTELEIISKQCSVGKHILKALGFRNGRVKITIERI